MEPVIDLYEMIKAYSRKINSPYIRIETLVSLLQRNAILHQEYQPALKQWLTNTREKVFSELARLSDEKKCIIQGEAPNQRIFLPDFFIEKIENIYFSIANSNDKPFPDESYFRDPIPDSFVREISVETGMIEYLEEPQQALLPVLKLIFPEKFGCALALSTHLPKRVLETALYKLHYSMQITRTLSFYQQKLMTRFVGQEHRVNKFMENITVHQDVCIDEIMEANDFTFSSWIFLCPLIKTQAQEMIDRDNEISPESIILYQVAAVLLAFNNYYKVAAINKRSKERAFAVINEKMAEPPYMYTFSSLLKLTGPGGVVILQRYNENDLKNWLKTNTTMTDNNLPNILKFESPNDADFFVRTDKLSLLCSSLLKDMQTRVKAEIINRWIRIMSDYYKEKAMENDLDFETLVAKTAKLYSPAIISIINDQKFDYLQHKIMEEEAEASKIFKNLLDGKVSSLKKILKLKRGDILLQSKLALPFWHSIPFVVVFCRILKHGIKKNAGYYTESEKDLDSVSLQQLKNNAKKISSEIVPGDTDIDIYMNKIIDRWNLLINKPSRERLTHDVNVIIKNYMQYLEKQFKHRILTHSMLDEVSDNIIQSNTALAKINNRNALRLYIKLFITKELLE
ncbi:MAG: hypothetical protein LBC27_08415 [Spirochaetaceae bacterium]|jgi:hypothetical protein|nr:hypothetical protein [Spirochaetaceae bacterium]